MSCRNGSSWHNLSEILYRWPFLPLSGLLKIFLLVGFKAGHDSQFLFWVKLSKLNLWRWKQLDGRSRTSIRTTEWVNLRFPFHARCIHTWEGPHFRMYKKWQKSAIFLSVKRHHLYKRGWFRGKCIKPCCNGYISEILML